MTGGGREKACVISASFAMPSPSTVDSTSSSTTSFDNFASSCASSTSCTFSFSLDADTFFFLGRSRSICWEINGVAERFKASAGDMGRLLGTLVSFCCDAVFLTDDPLGGMEIDGGKGIGSPATVSTTVERFLLAIIESLVPARRGAQVQYRVSRNRRIKLDG